ncbi:pyridoxamine 5'-phosphate oxidase [Flavihumibacter rivuli]|uniref:pyridoxamine 5'-phosphate oxidase n=1 Tax=Flavihumibacter rivuli TaxID=2838156 RepID=UPI001BDEAD1A|nr:pyridoxamine 5'-phosphate oxidase [Flavihumibacter rivuli]ULQ55274.1 pyridoxamine 5'-phosphate oxidase [Flavihumibacter rivuli]
MSIAAIRKDYMRHTLTESDVAADPISQFNTWWLEAMKSEIDEVNAMTLATASADGLPSARIVLLKGYDESGFVFFTNYHSFKGRQLEENPRACLVFFWKELERQVRITGLIEKVSEEESDTYFASRPVTSQIGALASPQSQVLASREQLEQTEKELAHAFAGKQVPRPAHWGGYRVKPITVEFWQGRPSRLHDRIHYTLEETGSWRIERLAP